MMPKCPQCKTQEKDRFRRPLAFAFKNQEIIYGCSRHRGVMKKELATDWFPLPKITWEDNPDATDL